MEEWARLGRLREGLTPDRALDIFLGLVLMYRLLVGESGWTVKAFDTWLKTTAKELLLKPP
jgi:hypothetical protein